MRVADVDSAADGRVPAVASDEDAAALAARLFELFCDQDGIPEDDRRFARVSLRRAIRRGLRAPLRVLKAERRPSRAVRRGRSARPGRARRSVTSRDDGGSDSPDSDGPAGRADARRTGARS